MCDGTMKRKGGPNTTSSRTLVMKHYPPLGSYRLQPSVSPGPGSLAPVGFCSLRPRRSQPSCAVCQRVRRLRMYCVSSYRREHISRSNDASSGLCAFRGLGSCWQLRGLAEGLGLCYGCNAGHHGVCAPYDNQLLCQPCRGQ